jgi:hypothetical protein
MWLQHIDIPIQEESRTALVFHNKEDPFWIKPLIFFSSKKSENTFHPMMMEGGIFLIDAK